uniref:Uncharacterized protein n=1 Tax=Panagrolaimus sp. ES5 TaxID=591445 RepID=A0AC34FQS9_9BILA
MCSNKKVVITLSSDEEIQQPEPSLLKNAFELLKQPRVTPKTPSKKGKTSTASTPSSSTKKATKRKSSSGSPSGKRKVVIGGTADSPLAIDDSEDEVFNLEGLGSSTPFKSTPKKRKSRNAAENDDDFIYFHNHSDYYRTHDVNPEMSYGVFCRYFFSLKPEGSSWSAADIIKWIRSNVLHFTKKNSRAWEYDFIKRLKKNVVWYPQDSDSRFKFTGTFPRVDAEDIYQVPEVGRKPLFTKYANEPVVDGWTYTDESSKEIKISGISHIYPLNITCGKVKYFVCADCESKRRKLGHQYQAKLDSGIVRLQLKGGVLRGKPQFNHLCEDEKHVAVAGRTNYGMFTAEDATKYLKTMQSAVEYLFGLMTVTINLMILQFVPEEYREYNANVKVEYLYGLAYADDPRNFWYFGVSYDPWRRFQTHKCAERTHMFYNSDGSEREVLMIIILCMPSHHYLAYELEAALIRYGQHYHQALSINEAVTNNDPGIFQDPHSLLKSISHNTQHADFGTVGKALSALLDDGANRGPRISSLAIGKSDKQKMEAIETYKQKRSF